MADAVHSTAKLTYDDLVAMFPAEDGVRRELIDGELFVTPSPFVPHQRLVVRLTTALANHLELHPGQGEVFGSPLDVVMTPYDVVEARPDDQSGNSSIAKVCASIGLSIPMATASPSTAALPTDRFRWRQRSRPRTPRH